MKKFVLFLIALFFMGLSNVTDLQAWIPPDDGGSDGGGGGGGGSTPSYVTAYVSAADVLSANGYSVTEFYNWEYIGASAISPYGSCQVTRVNTPTWKVKVYTDGYVSRLTFDFFLKVRINGVQKELRYIYYDNR